MASVSKTQDDAAFTNNQSITVVLDEIGGMASTIDLLVITPCDQSVDDDDAVRLSLKTPRYCGGNLTTIAQNGKENQLAHFQSAISGTYTVLVKRKPQSDMSKSLPKQKFHVVIKV